MGVHPRYSQRNLDNLRKELYEVKTTGYKQCQQELGTAKKEYKEGKGTMTCVLELEKRLEKHIPSEIHFIENNIKAIENAIRTGKYPDVSDGWGGTVPGKAWTYKDEPAKIERDGLYGSGEIWPKSDIGAAVYGGALIGGILGAMGILIVPLALHDAGAGESTIIKAMFACLPGAPIAGGILGGIGGVIADAVKSGKGHKKEKVQGGKRYYKIKIQRGKRYKIKIRR